MWWNTSRTLTCATPSRFRLQEEGGIEAFLQPARCCLTPPTRGTKPTSVKTGYEISFTRYFYKPTPMRTLEEIRVDILALEQETEGCWSRSLGKQTDGHPALLCHATPHRDSPDLGEVGVISPSPRSSALCLGRDEGSEPPRLALPGLPSRLPHLLAQSDRQAQGRFTVRGQTHPYRRPTAGDRTDGGTSRTGSPDQGLRTVHIRIAFHPGDERFEVHNPAIAKDGAWIDDVTAIFGPMRT